jgi:hypothetical protein
VSALYLYNALTLDPSGAGNGCLSISVIWVSLNCGFLHSDHAVERPKTPLPMMRMEDGMRSAYAIVKEMKTHDIPNESKETDKEKKSEAYLCAIFT